MKSSTVPALPRLVRIGSRPRAGLGTYRPPPRSIVDQRGRVWPVLDVAKPDAEGQPCGDHCLPFGSPDGPMRWLNEPARAKPAPRAPVALRGYRPWQCPPFQGRPQVSSPLYNTPCLPPAMGSLDRWTCPSGDTVLIRSGAIGMSGCGPCGGLAGSCGGKCACKGCSKGMGSLTSKAGSSSPAGACPGGVCAITEAPTLTAWDIHRQETGQAVSAFARLDRQAPDPYESPTTVVGPGAITSRGYAEAPRAAAPSSGSSTPSFWQSLLDELSGSKGEAASRSMAESYASAYKAASFTVPNIASATDDIQSIMAAAARAAGVYDTSGQRSYAALSQPSKPLALEPSLFRLPGRAPLIGPFGEQPKAASAGIPPVVIVAGAGVALLLAVKAWKKHKGPTK